MTVCQRSIGLIPDDANQDLERTAKAAAPARDDLVVYFPLRRSHLGQTDLSYPTTGRSAPVPRLGTLIRMGTTHLDFSLRIGATGSRVPCKSPVQSHAAFMPDAVWAEIRTPPRLVPGYRLPPGFDSVSKLSTRHQRFACARLSEPYLTGSRFAFFRNVHHDGS
jgi:hypothetical protein